ncbi:MAG: hypothetical protein WC248_06690, partial [Candidatus Methanomethylophilaceae archaeon]
PGAVIFLFFYYPYAASPWVRVCYLSGTHCPFSVSQANSVGLLKSQHPCTMHTFLGREDVFGCLNIRCVK